MMVFDSGSPAINFFNFNGNPLIRQAVFNENNVQDKLCVLRGSYYENAGCLICENSIVTTSRQCIPYCPFGVKNGLNNVCRACLEPNCEEFDSTKWELTKIDQENWKLRPTRKILNSKIDPNIFKITLDGQEDSSKSFDYTVKKADNDKQEFDVKFNFKDDLKEENIIVKSTQDPDNLLYDENRNLLYKDAGVAFIDRVCYVSDSREKSMKALAYIILIGFIVVFVVLLLMTCLCWKRYWDIAGAWKFFLHHWMKLQLVAFLALLALYMPCCIRAFLHTLYKYAVSWNHHLREAFNDSYEDSNSYNKGFIKKDVNDNMDYEDVKSFFLHNFGIFFIVHLCVLLVYILIKIWDCLKNSTNSSKMYKVLVYMEFSLLIVFFMVVDIQVFGFGFINMRQAYFKHVYFVFCFLIALCYLIVFLGFWLYSFANMYFRKDYFNYPENHNSFHFYFVGFKENGRARSFDLWVLICHFFFGMWIGILMFNALTQIILIFVTLVILFAYTLLARPWTSIWYNICDIISQLLILIAVVIFLIFQAWDEGDCKECGDREGVLCWLIVLFLFFALLLGLLGALLGALWSLYKGEEDEEEVIIHETDEIIVNKNTEIVNNVNNYEKVYNNEMTTTNHGGVMVRETINSNYLTANNVKTQN
jgi:hypothetical protein